MEPFLQHLGAYIVKNRVAIAGDIIKTISQDDAIIHWKDCTTNITTSLRITSLGEIVVLSDTLEEGITEISLKMQ